jgi:hypothetical protein
MTAPPPAPPVTQSADPAREVLPGVTVSDMMAAMRVLASEISPNAECAFMVMYRYGGNHGLLTVYPSGIAAASERCHHFDGFSFQETIAKARAWSVTYLQERSETLIRRLALAIIDLYDGEGRATVEALAKRDFKPAEILEFRDAACFRASSMAGLRPFTVEAA